MYGPRARTSGTYGAVFGVFLAQKLANKPFTVVGDGSQTRDFTYVSDIVSALFAAAESSVSGEIINIGSNNTYSINRLVELLEGEVVFIPKRPGEPDCTWADINKAKKREEEEEGGVERRRIGKTRRTTRRRSRRRRRMKKKKTNTKKKMEKK